MRTLFSVVASGGLILLGLAAAPPAARAQTLVEHSGEARFQLDFIVPQAAITRRLPPGYTMNISTQGAATNVNLRVVFIDRLTINGPDNTPVGRGTNRLVYLIVPVRDPGGTTGQLVIGGLTEDGADAPGPFGVYLPATTHTMQRSSSNRAGELLESQDWIFTAASGEHLEMHITFERGVANKGNPNEVRFFSAANPAFYQISRQEQVLHILRNPTTNPPDRVREFSFHGGGGSYADIFDGTERVVSWDNILWINRSVLVP